MLVRVVALEALLVDVRMNVRLPVVGVVVLVLDVLVIMLVVGVCVRLAAVAVLVAVRVGVLVLCLPHRRLLSLSVYLTVASETALSP